MHIFYISLELDLSFCVFVRNSLDSPGFCLFSSVSSLVITPAIDYVGKIH